MAYLLLGVSQIAGLILILFGLPGLWVQVGALALFAWATDFATVGAFPIGVVLFLALVAEVAEFLLAGRYAQRYGGGRRAVWGAILGGIAGAVLGVPVPLIGSVIGAMVGSFAGAALLELTAGKGASPALRAGWGAFLGRVVAVAMKGGLSVVVAVFSLAVAFR